MHEGDPDDASFSKDLAVAVMVVAGFVAAISLPVVSLPGFVLMRGFDAVQGMSPTGTFPYAAALLAYLFGYALVAALAASGLRRRVDLVPWWYAPVATALVVVGVSLLAVTAGVLVPDGADAAFVALAVVAALVLLAIAWVTVRGGRRRFAEVRRLRREMAEQSGAPTTTGDSSPADDQAGDAAGAADSGGSATVDRESTDR